MIRLVERNIVNSVKTLIEGVSTTRRDKDRAATEIRDQGSAD